MGADPDGEVRFQPTLTDLLAAQTLGSRSAWWRYGFGGAACGVAAAAVTIASGDFSLPTNALIGVFVGLGYAAVLALIWRFWFPARIAKLYRQQASLRQPHVVTWDALGLRVETAQAMHFVRWGDYVKRRENEAVILLYQSDAVMQFLPKRAFSETQVASLRRHLDGMRPG